MLFFILYYCLSDAQRLGYNRHSLCFASARYQVFHHRGTTYRLHGRAISGRYLLLYTYVSGWHSASGGTVPTNVIDYLNATLFYFFHYLWPATDRNQLRLRIRKWDVACVVPKDQWRWGKRLNFEKHAFFYIKNCFQSRGNIYRECNLKHAHALPQLFYIPRHHQKVRWWINTFR